MNDSGVVLVERECLDLQEVGDAEQAVELETEGMRGQLGVEAGAQAGERMCMVGFNVELLVELAVDRLDDLAGAVEQTTDGRRQLAVSR